MFFRAARGVGAVEAVKDLCFKRIRDAGAAVRDFKFQGCRRVLAEGQRQMDCPPGRGVRDRVVKKDRKRLPDSLGVAIEAGACLPGQGDGEGDGFLPAEGEEGFVCVHQERISVQLSGL